ncbi:DNA-binding response regulator [Caballeronia calidae]|uniref:DNA-binding response regulator n=1 Tax=Caballeronia calidae TaxID=1777139 RepID=A0A158BQH5_9BURK|nr:response regulator transcription factor [Caballeronia calidae]SAK72261.1 DNA-binding response regulator [Caballeronia calidae]
MRLLLVEGDDAKAETVIAWMRLADYSIDWKSDGAAARQALSRENYDLLLLALNVPQLDSIELLISHRKAGGTTPAIILTEQGEAAERVRGLYAGADDHMTRPLDQDELSARVHFWLRRRKGHAQKLFRHGELMLDPTAREAKIAGKPLHLTPREFAVLHALIEVPAAVVSMAELKKKVYASAGKEESGTNTIQVYVNSLRRKLGEDTILTIRGVGYRLS